MFGRSAEGEGSSRTSQVGLRRTHPNKMNNCEIPWQRHRFFFSGPNTYENNSSQNGLQRYPELVPHQLRQISTYPELLQHQLRPISTYPNPPISHIGKKGKCICFVIFPIIPSAHFNLDDRQRCHTRYLGPCRGILYAGSHSRACQKTTLQHKLHRIFGDS